MIGVLVEQGIIFSFNKKTAGFSVTATVMSIGDWSKVAR